LFAELGPSLPISTRIVLGLAHWLESYAWLLLPVIAVAVLSIRHAWRTPPRAGAWTSSCSVPRCSGSLVARLETARFCRSLGTLLASGVSVIAGLSIARESVSNRVISDARERRSIASRTVGGWWSAGRDGCLPQAGAADDAGR
jgi:general secretion pathway protein F